MVELFLNECKIDHCATFIPLCKQEDLALQKNKGDEKDGFGRPRHRYSHPYVPVLQKINTNSVLRIAYYIWSTGADCGGARAFHDG